MKTNTGSFLTNDIKLNNGNLSEMTLTELQDIAIRQQQQIEINQQLLLAKEKRLKLLKIEDQKNQQLSMLTSNSFNMNGISYNIHHQQQQQQQQPHQKQTSNGHSKTIENANKLENLKQSVLGQELKIFKLKELRNQIIKHKLSNSNMNSELELIKSLFTKKERELCDAIKNVSELTKQIEQLRKIKSLSFNTQSMNGTAQPLNMLSANNKNNINACELEKLKQELQIRNKLNEQQAKKIMQQHDLFNQKQLEVLNLDRRIEDLQNRISNKRNLNEQINITCSKLKSNSFALSPKHDESLNQQLLIKDIDHNININNEKYNEDCETQEFINDQASYNNQNIIIHQQIQQQEKHSYQSNITSSETVTNTTANSPSKTTAKFATKQEIANTYMNKYGSETFQRFQQNSIKILQQQQQQQQSPSISLPLNEQTNDNSSPASPIETPSQSNNKNSTNFTFQSDNCTDSPSFTALPSHLKLEFDKIKYLPDMIKTIKKRHSISEVEGSSCSNTIPPLIFQKMLEKHHKNFLDQKQQQNQQKKLNQIQETPTEITSPITTSTTSTNINNNITENKIQPKNETTIHEILVQENQQSNINEVKSEKIIDSIELNDSKDSTPVITSTITKSTKPIIKQTNNFNNDNNFSNNWNNNKGNGALFQNNNNNSRRVNFDPHALLLDAAVEGELDLVMKCAKLVNDISEPNDEGITALHNSVCAGHFDIVKFLVEFGCDINFADNDGWTPLHCAASCNNLPMVKFLLEHGASVFATTLSDNETSIKKCEEDEEGYEACYEYLITAQKNLGDPSFNNGIAYGLYSYDAENDDELSFKAGDELIILEKYEEDFQSEENDGWWNAKLVNQNKQGLVPNNYLGLYPRVRSSRGHQESTVC